MNAQKQLQRQGFDQALVIACPSYADHVVTLRMLDAALSALFAAGDTRYTREATILQAAVRQELLAQPPALRFAENVVYVASDRWRKGTTP